MFKQKKLGFFKAMNLNWIYKYPWTKWHHFHRSLPSFLNVYPFSNHWKSGCRLYLFYFQNVMRLRSLEAEQLFRISFKFSTFVCFIKTKNPQIRKREIKWEKGMAYVFGEELKLNYAVHSVILELITSSCVLSVLISRWMADDICLHLNNIKTYRGTQEESIVPMRCQP